MQPPSAALNVSSSHVVYTTGPGRVLVHKILSQCESVPIEPHDYQCEGICRSLDGDDVIATMATGASLFCIKFNDDSACVQTLRLSKFLG